MFGGHVRSFLIRQRMIVLVRAPICMRPWQERPFPRVFSSSRFCSTTEGSDLFLAVRCLPFRTNCLDAVNLRLRMSPPTGSFMRRMVMRDFSQPSMTRINWPVTGVRAYSILPAVRVVEYRAEHPRSA